MDEIKREQVISRSLALFFIVFFYFSRLLFYKHNFTMQVYPSGIGDLGHYYIPPALQLFGLATTQYLFWIAGLPEEIIMAVIPLVILFTGKGIRLGLCLHFTFWLHWILWHFTVLPVPEESSWTLPPHVFSFSVPFHQDFWFSGHVALMMLVALAIPSQYFFLRLLAWLTVVFEIFVVLSTRTHYSIDVLGGIFVAYSVHQFSLQAQDKIHHWIEKYCSRNISRRRV